MQKFDLFKIIVIGVIAAIVASVNLTFGQSSNKNDYEFSADGKECIIYNPDLPTPWLNRLSNDVFFTWITHRGGIECFLLDPRIMGLTNPQETSGFIYLRDSETGEYFMLNRPIGDEKWRSIVGLGYSKLICSSLGLTGSATYFVPRDENVLVILVNIKNNTNNKRKVDLFSQVEWNLGDPVKSIIYKGDGRGGSQLNLYKKTDFKNDVIYAQQKIWKLPVVKPWPFTGFFFSSESVTSYETIKDNFIGLGHDMTNPLAMENGRCTNTLFWNQDEYPWGVLHNSIELGPRAEKKIVLVVGMADKEQNIAKIKQKYSRVSFAEQKLQKTKDFYDQLLAKSINVRTPEKNIDRIINIWSKYQWRNFMKKSLNNGHIGLGLWSYGLEGSRLGGSNEVATHPVDLDILKSSIISHLQNQVWEYTLGQIAVSIPTIPLKYLDEEWPPKEIKGKFAVPHHHDLLFYFYSIPIYLKETGDFSFLNEELPYIDGKKGTVFDHMKRAVDYALTVLSKRGLPLINAGVGDWMDEFTMLSKEGKAESVMFAMQLCFFLKEYADIAKVYGKTEIAGKWMKKYNFIKDAVNKYSWDGEWYIRAFSDRGEELVPVGTSKNAEGKIYLNAQSWAILGGVADKERATKCLNSVDKYLISEFGPMIFYPPYSKLNEYVGVQSIYAPGFRNACIYFRPTGWAIMAACLNDQPDLAFKMYKNACLSKVSQNIKRFHCEPYVYPENYIGPDHLFGGQGQFQWNLGEGTNWMWHSYVYYILGIRPVLEGLLVDPKIPKEWPGYKMSRSFRGSFYDIEVKNPDGVSMGIKEIFVDGKKIQGNLIRGHKDGNSHKIVVLMGN